MKVIFIVLCMLIGFLAMFGEEIVSNNQSKEIQKNMNTLKHFKGKIKEDIASPSFAFFIDKEVSEINSFAEKACILKLGMKQDAVFKILGSPTVSQKVAGKKNGSPSKLYWNYYLKKKDKDSVNEKWDTYLFLIFSSGTELLEDIKFIKGNAYE